MDNTIKINLGGILFQIDEGAYKLLRDYLQAIDTRFRYVAGGAETIEDIESRIAEIFQSKNGAAGVISKENVEEMISVIGRPEEFDQPESESESPHYGTRRKKMFRNPDDTIIGGVCGGIGAYLNTDPVWIRILFILFALCFGAGFILYLALWIALPLVKNDAQKKEMYGNAFYSNLRQNRQSEDSDLRGASKVGNAFNEVFMALGKVFYIFLRVVLIIIGISLVLTGFLALLSFVMVFLFKYPGSFSTNIEGVNLSYIPDFLNFIVAPSVVPWITVLTTIVVILPLFALIYWGVKMIFWFKAKDGIFSLVALVLWVMSIAALSIILFNEGVGYAETGKATSSKILKESPDTLYIKSGKSLSELKYDHEISIPDDEYEIFIAEENKQIFVRTYLGFEPSENNNAVFEVRKRSAGRNRADALLKAEALQYNFSFIGDTLYLDEYFTYPSGTKWAFDEVGATLAIPEGTVINMDNNVESMIRRHHRNYYDMDSENLNPEDRFWQLTKEGLRHCEPK